MNSGDYQYIWQAGDWPHWRFDLATLAAPMAAVSHAQGLLIGRLADVGMALRDQASLGALTEDVIKTSAIEGEQLHTESVRSSIARKLGMDIGGLAPVDRHVEGVVEMVLDATGNCTAAGLARRTVSHGVQRPEQNQRRQLAQRCQRGHAGGIRPHRPPKSAF